MSAWTCSGCGSEYQYQIPEHERLGDKYCGWCVRNGAVAEPVVALSALPSRLSCFGAGVALGLFLAWAYRCL